MATFATNQSLQKVSQDENSAKGCNGFEEFPTVALTRESISHLTEWAAHLLESIPRSCQIGQRNESFVKDMVSISFGKQSMDAAERHEQFPSLNVIQHSDRSYKQPDLALSGPLTHEGSRMRAMLKALYSVLVQFNCSAEG